MDKLSSLITLLKRGLTSCEGKERKLVE